MKTSKWLDEEPRFFGSILTWLIVMGALVVLFLFSGCAGTPMNVVMTNPETGRSVYIAHHSYGFGMRGITAALEADRAQRLAIEGAKAMGYTEMKEIR